MAFDILCDDIVRLDSILTGRHEAHTARNAHSQASVLADALDFVTSRSPYHLSDEGRSRLYMTPDGSIRLSSSSASAVKTAWLLPEAKEAAERFKSAVMDLAESKAKVSAVGILDAARGIVPGR